MTFYTKYITILVLVTFLLVVSSQTTRKLSVGEKQRISENVNICCYCKHILKIFEFLDFMTSCKTFNLEIANYCNSISTMFIELYKKIIMHIIDLMAYIFFPIIHVVFCIFDTLSE